MPDITSAQSNRFGSDNNPMLRPIPKIKRSITVNEKILGEYEAKVETKKALIASLRVQLENAQSLDARAALIKKRNAARDDLESARLDVEYVENMIDEDLNEADAVEACVRKGVLPDYFRTGKIDIQTGVTSPYQMTARTTPVTAESPRTKSWVTINSTTFECLYCDYSVGDMRDPKKPVGISVVVASEADALISTLKGKTVTASVVQDALMPVITGYSLNVVLVERVGQGAWRIGMLGGNGSVRES